MAAAADFSSLEGVTVFCRFAGGSEELSAPETWRELVSIGTSHGGQTDLFIAVHAFRLRGRLLSRLRL